MTKEVVLNVRKLKLRYKVETTRNKYYFSEETIIKYSIFKEREFTKEEFEEIAIEEEKNSFLNKAINYLSYQSRSINEVKKYLVNKDCSLELANNIILKIVELGYLNDEALANSILDYTMRTNKGPRILEQNLMKKELTEELIKATVNRYSVLEEQEILEDFLEKLLVKYKNYPVKKQKTLIYQKLLRDGFSNEVISYEMNKVNFIDESAEQLEKDIRKLLNKYDEITFKERSLIINKLINKGYDYSKIIECLNNVE